MNPNYSSFTSLTKVELDERCGPDGKKAEDGQHERKRGECLVCSTTNS